LRPLAASNVAPPFINLEKPYVYVAILITSLGFTSSDEQHIMQKTMARKRYPVFEKLLELDLDLTSCSDSSLSSVKELAPSLLPLSEVVATLSSSIMFLCCPEGKNSRELSIAFYSTSLF